MCCFCAFARLRTLGGRLTVIVFAINILKALRLFTFTVHIQAVRMLEFKIQYSKITYSTLTSKVIRSFHQLSNSLSMYVLFTSYNLKICIFPICFFSTTSKTQHLDAFQICTLLTFSCTTNFVSSWSDFQTDDTCSFNRSWFTSPHMNITRAMIKIATFTMKY